MEQKLRNNKGKKALNYKRNRSNSSHSSSNENKRNFKHSRSNSSSNSHSGCNSVDISNNSQRKFGNNSSMKKNKSKHEEIYNSNKNYNNTNKWNNNLSNDSSNSNSSEYNSTKNNINNNGNLKNDNYQNNKNSLSKSVLLKQSFKYLKDNKKNYHSSRYFKNNKNGHKFSYGNNYNYNNSYEASSSNSNRYTSSSYLNNNTSSTSSSQYNNDNDNSSTTTDNNNEPTILNIPGYYYDKEKKKYFKIQKNGISTSEYSQSSVKEKEKEEKSKLQQDLEKLKIKSNNKNYNIRTLILNRELGNLIGNNNIEKYIYNKLFSNIKCQQTTRHREISHISLASSGKVIALGHVNGYASIKVRGQISNENSIYSCAKIASSKVSSIKVFENDNLNYHIFASSLGGEDEPGTLNIYKYILNNNNEEFIPVFSLIKKTTYKNSTIQCCSISDSLNSYITLGDRFNALIHPNIQSICSDIKHNTISMPTKTDIMIQRNTKKNLLYNGCRNGNIEIIDLNNLKLNTSKNFIQHSSSVCDIQQINDTLFISNSMDGGIYIWDIRGGTSSPSTFKSEVDKHHHFNYYNSRNPQNHNKNWVVQELYGNCNEYLRNNIAVDSNKGVIVTAGQDGQLRAWNIYNGEMIFSKHLPNYVNNTTTTVQLDQSDSLISFWTANSVNLSLWSLRF